MHSFSTHPFSARCRGWLVGLLLFSLVSPSMVSADIFEWEWVNPGDHSQGKQPSTTLVPDGAGLVPGPGLSGYNKNLTQAYLIGFDMAATDFRRTILTAADLSGSNLTDTHFNGSILSSTDLHDSNLTNTLFFTARLVGADLHGSNLTGVDFRAADLHSADLSGSNLTDANLNGYRLSYANLTAADARAARYGDFSSAPQNLIYPDGHIEGLNIIASEEMRLWDFSHAAPIPILIQNALSIDSTGTLRTVFEDDDWGSTLTFDAGIGVSLDGTLELLIDSREGSNVSSMVGVTFDLFDWTGVTPSGTFAQITTDAGLVWDTSDLYSTGEVTLLSAPSVLFADFDDNGVVDEADLDAWRAAFGSTTDLDADGNGDGVIDAADYTVWRDNFVAPPSGDYDGNGVVDDADLLVWRAAFGSTTDLDADGNGNGVIDAADYTVWRDNYVAASVAVPEPTAFLLTLLGLASCGGYRRRGDVGSAVRTDLWTQSNHNGPHSGPYLCSQNSPGGATDFEL